MALCDLWSNCYKQQGRHSGIMGPGFKLEVSWVLKIQQTEASSTGLRISSQELLFNYMQIFLFLKNHHFGKCSHLQFLYIIGYIYISGRPTPRSPSQILGRGTRLSTLQDWGLWVWGIILRNCYLIICKSFYFWKETTFESVLISYSCAILYPSRSLYNLRLVVYF